MVNREVEYNNMNEINFNINTCSTNKSSNVIITGEIVDETQANKQNISTRISSYNICATENKKATISSLKLRKDVFGNVIDKIAKTHKVTFRDSISKKGIVDYVDFDKNLKYGQKINCKCLIF